MISRPWPWHTAGGWLCTERGSNCHTFTSPVHVVRCSLVCIWPLCKADQPSMTVSDTGQEPFYISREVRPKMNWVELNKIAATEMFMARKMIACTV